MVDGAHAFAQLDFRIPDLDCDYYGASLHKWLGTPLGAGIEADLPDDVEGLRRTVLDQGDGVVTVPETRSGRLGGPIEHGLAGSRTRQHEHGAARDRAGEGDRARRRRRPVEVEANRVTSSGEVDRGSGSVVDLERLVAARPLDVLTEEELGGRRRGDRRSDDGHDPQRQNSGGDAGDPAANTAANTATSKHRVPPSVRVLRAICRQARPERRRAPGENVDTE